MESEVRELSKVGGLANENEEKRDEERQDEEG